MEPILSRITHPASPADSTRKETVPMGIRNIIFDFGGVLCNLDVKRTERAFAALGFAEHGAKPGAYDPPAMFEAVECGELNPDRFREELRRFIPQPVTDEQLDAAWNALLLDVPAPRIRMLEALRKDYRLFLLSNSNEIHYCHYSESLFHTYGYRFEDLFEKPWFSYRIGLCKPSQEIFRYVLREAGLDPYETLFVDDTRMHAEAAQQAGIHAIHLDLGRGEEVTQLFL